MKVKVALAAGALAAGLLIGGGVAASMAHANDQVYKQALTDRGRHCATVGVAVALHGWGVDETDQLLECLIEDYRG